MSYSQCNGIYQTEYEKLFRALVPEKGDAESVQGQLLLAISNLSNQYYRRWGWMSRQEEFLSFLKEYFNPDGYYDDTEHEDEEGKSPFLDQTFDETTRKQINEDLFFIELGRPTYDEYDSSTDVELYSDWTREYAYEESLRLWPQDDLYGPFSRLTDRVIEWCFLHPKLMPYKNSIIQNKFTIDEILGRENKSQ